MMKITPIYDQKFYDLLEQYKNNPKALNHIRTKLFTILYDRSRDCQDEDINEGVMNFLASFNAQHIDNFFQRLQNEKIDFIPNNAEKISKFFLNYCQQACYHKTLDIKRDKYRLLTVSLDAQLSSDSHTSFIDMIPDHRKTPEEVLITEENRTIIKQILKDETLHKIHPINSKECHFLAVLIRRLQGKTLDAIAQEFDIKKGTFRAFWHRKCKPILRAKFSV